MVRERGKEGKQDGREEGGRVWRERKRRGIVEMIILCLHIRFSVLVYALFFLNYLRKCKIITLQLCTFRGRKGFSFLLPILH